MRARIGAREKGIALLVPREAVITTVAGVVIVKN